MSRSKWKGPHVDDKLLGNMLEAKASQTVITQSRNSTIIPSFIGTVFKVHNGKSFYQIKIVEEMVGYKLGEFAPTRKTFSFKKTKQK